MFGFLCSLWSMIDCLLSTSTWLAVNLGVPILALYFTLRSYMALTNGRCLSKRQMRGKTVIITGANSGLGFETAKDMALRGARVIMACRNMAKAEIAREAVLQATGAKSSYVILKKLDLASLRSVRSFALDILQTEKRLDVLINNAGLSDPKRTERTEDNLEYNMACNHFGHFLLTNLLLDLLKTSAPSRIVVVSSMAHVGGDVSPDALRGIGRKKWQIYSDTKLANIVFAEELSRRLAGTNVTVNSLHPGVVATEFMQHIPNELAKTVAKTMVGLFKTPEEGAQTQIHLAVSEEVEGVTGKYFSDCKPARVWNSQSHDRALAAKVWRISEELTN
ncbi:unnamed protein product [Notodromas monacha]|uniref:Retinol dehydrogenase 13 n=2 Tax=Notodromas monacha TaxID=399045 RepID=A0A7R9BFS3_9CRUS|nr:unnamed protein product [Notodromas monacha]CAG0914462.1 unnamed protein product [Notodromas monacha]